jgi:gluconokinase
MTFVILIMGVAGVGKTTIGRMAADRTGWDFIDADDFHPDANIRKMQSGMALTDKDRLPWLEALAGEIRQRMSARRPMLVACSALKEQYRTLLRSGITEFHLVYLKTGYEIVRHRCQQRTGHFYPPELLESQFRDLEEPKDALVLDASQCPEVLVEAICQNTQLINNSAIRNNI